MEYVDGGELFHYVEQRRGLPEDETVVIFRQIVSALLYCHRLHICHRDLKPENILLNQANLQVKLIDFGMAALQPQGRLLSTPCGSPHYAAPEVVSSRPYDGKQADAWSCGVILYVMLTGMTPYNYSQDGDIRALFRDISKAKYVMPPELSYEAKDLIRKIFVPDPKHRITMDNIWDHPLLHKYDKVLGFDGPQGSKEAAIGPIPKLEDWTIKRAEDVDREILRNMRTLWHSEPEQSLIQKLLNKTVNQEKIFYAALMKHRDENLENYVGDIDGMGYSASDYHHAYHVREEDVPPLPLDRQERSQSQYSIMNDEHLRPSHSFVEPPPSVSSYDPYRASKDPIVNRGDYVNVVVHRSGSSGARRASARASLRQPNSLRVDMLKHGSHRTSNTSNTSNSKLARSAHSKSSLRRSSTSRHSLSSSIWPSSPPVIASMKPSDVHKRRVSFTHGRRPSTASAATSQASTKATPVTPRPQHPFQDKSALMPSTNVFEVPDSSPTLQTGQVIRSRKEKAELLEMPRGRVRGAETPGKNLRSEIRKHSVELEKACEEAFYRSSVGSNLTSYSTFTERASPSATPPSSVSARGSATPDLNTLQKAARPLPEVPRDTPTSYLTRTLEETREKLAAYKSQSEGAPGKIDEVMKVLDNIMPPSQRQEKRLTSAPEVRTGELANAFLPIISEEGDGRSSREAAQANWYRSVTAPVSQDRRAGDQTIRAVPASSPLAIAPLNVRKRSNGAEAGEDSRGRLTVQQPHEHVRRQRSRETTTVLEAIDENEVLPPPARELRKKKSGWFALGKKTAESESDRPGMTDQAAYVSQGGRLKRRSSDALSKAPVQKPLPEEPPMSAVSSEFPLRKKRFGGGKRGFSKWLGRLGAEGKGPEDETIGESWKKADADLFG